MRFSRIRARGVVVVSAAVMALQGMPALAQFMPYQGNAYQGNANQAYSQYQSHAAQQTNPQYAPQTYAPPQYTAMAYQGASAQGSSSRALNPAAEAVAPGYTQVPGYTQQPAPAAQPNHNLQPMPSGGGYESYPQSYGQGGCASNACGGYNTFDSGCGTGGCSTGGRLFGGRLGGYGRCGAGGCDVGGCDSGCGVGSCFDGCGRGCGRKWFGGVYGLFMERAGSDWNPLAFSVADATPAGYYPAPADYVLNRDDVTNTQHGGAEIRLGYVLGGRDCCGCGPRYAIEVAYWGLAQQENVASYDDQTGERLYGMVDYRGLEYDNGYVAGYRPLNHYYDNAPPTADYATGWPNAIEVQRVTVSSTFSAQNIEVNLLRLPMLSSGCGCATSSCGGCDAGGCGVNPCAGAPCRASRCSVTTLLGVRYMRFDEDFYLRSDYIEDPTGGAWVDWVQHNVEADNHLVGLQLGCNGIYHMGCSGRFALHCNTNAGIFGNHMEVRQYFSGNGDAQYDGGGNDFDIETEDDDIAMVAELRAGISCRVGCNWRLYTGYRAIGVSGVALSYDQIPSNFSSDQQVNYVNSEGSIFLHGLQAGLGCSY